MNLPLHYRHGGIEFCDQGRCIRVEDVSPGKSTRRRAPAALAVYCDGILAGQLTFYETGSAHRHALSELKTRFGMELGLLGRITSKRAEIARELGIDLLMAATTDEARAAAIRELRRRGRRVGYVGDSTSHPLTARSPRGDFNRRSSGRVG